MFIDGLIQFCKRKSENIKLKAEPQVFVEIANKLEELKAIKSDGFTEDLLNRGYVKGYNKAIDEFVRKVCEKYTEEESKGHYKQYCVNIKQDIADMAEQMKAGVKNE